jgi:hypothetical protein
MAGLIPDLKIGPTYTISMHPSHCENPAGANLLKKSGKYFWTVLVFGRTGKNASDFFVHGWTGLTRPDALGLAHTESRDPAPI